MKSLGFVGTGTITAALVQGLKTGPLAAVEVVLSPRGAAVAARLAASFAGVRVAGSNQAVVDGAEVVVLAVRPQVAPEVLAGLRIAPEQEVISLIAGFDHDRIAALTGARAISRAVPLPFVAARRDVVPVYPPRPAAMALFAALGTALPVADRAAFDVYAGLSALMGSYFGVVETAADWAAGRGLPPAAARAYLGSLFCNLGLVLRDSGLSPAELRADHSTAGGMNEQVFAEFARDGGLDALQAALASVLARIEGRPKPPVGMVAPATKGR